ncbi:biotin/lipoate--protein ligase family protein [Roseibium sp.]|uniref:biotin/lipoate--protein ligase family protein n=1 Tax=Roseibium sp. TaxID=1936156 RepID=UPI003A97FB22
MTAIPPFSDLILPPLLNSRPVVPPDDPFEAACQAAAADQADTGDLFWSTRADRLTFGLVLAPEVKPEQARHMLFVMMVAAADALGAIAPPEIGITWAWPATVLANRGKLGGARMAMSQSVDDDGAPDWLVVGLDLALQPDSLQGQGDSEPGQQPDVTSLWDEGAAELDTVGCLESLSRHFLTWLHRWESEGFRPVQEAWLFRCEGYKQEIEVSGPDGSRKGRLLGLDEAGNLLLKPEGCAVDQVDLAATLQQWEDA